MRRRRGRSKASVVLLLLALGCGKEALLENGVSLNLRCRVLTQGGKGVPGARIELHDRLADRFLREHRAFVCTTDTSGSCAAEVGYRFHTTERAEAAPPRPPEEERMELLVRAPGRALVRQEIAVDAATQLNGPEPLSVEIVITDV